MCIQPVELSPSRSDRHFTSCQTDRVQHPELGAEQEGMSSAQAGAETGPGMTHPKELHEHTPSSSGTHLQVGNVAVATMPVPVPLQVTVAACDRSRVARFGALHLWRYFKGSTRK